MKIISFFADRISFLWKGAQSLVVEFEQTRSVQEKFAIAHRFVLPIFIIFVLLLFWLDKYDSPKEKLFYAFYFVLLLEFLIFISVFVSVLS